MKKFSLVLAMLMLSVGLFACTAELNPGSGDNNDIKLGELKASGCKDAPSAKLVNDSDTSNEDGVAERVIEAVVGDDFVNIIHYNAWYQCDAEILYTLAVDGNNLTLIEIPKADVVTNCICNMDLEIVIENLKEGEVYHIEVWNEHKTEMFGEVDVKVGDCEPPYVCETDRDCYNMDLPVPACIGDWNCIEGLCEFNCQGEELRCNDNADCPGGYECVWYPTEGEVVPGERGETSTGSVNTDSDPDSNDNSSDPMPAFDCESDADCPEGMLCELYECDDAFGDPSGAEEQCMSFGMCVDQKPEPPEEILCGATNDCPVGMFCAIADCAKPDDGHMPDCEPNTDCMPTPDCEPYGVCMYEEPPKPEYGYCEPMANECNFPEDCYDWEMDFMPDPNCKFDCIDNMCVMFCQNNECFSDIECPPDQHCEFSYYDGGMPRPDTDPEGDENMPYPEGGVCVPNNQEGCYSDEECPADFHCEFYWDGNGEETPLPSNPPEDVECGEGDTNFKCMPEPQGGVCVPNDPQPNSCEDLGGKCFPYSSEQRDCPEGFEPAYELYYQQPLCGMEAVCCVPSTVTECSTDADCYMDDVPGGYLNMLCIDGICQENCNCDAEYAPVCGADGQTYSNKCVAGCANVEVAYEGECDNSCTCYEIYAPVCGVDDKTYSNDCFAKCENVEIAYEGECRQEGCESNADCPEGMQCMIDCDDTDPNGDQTDCSPYGVCEPLPSDECSSNQDCPSDQYCETCPPDPDCPVCAVCGPPVCMER